jgi:hypothetical protein
MPKIIVTTRNGESHELTAGPGISAMEIIWEAGIMIWLRNVAAVALALPVKPVSMLFRRHCWLLPAKSNAIEG